jgi:hypothetical protein
MTVLLVRDAQELIWIKLRSDQRTRPKDYLTQNTPEMHMAASALR